MSMLQRKQVELASLAGGSRSPAWQDLAHGPVVATKHSHCEDCPCGKEPCWEGKVRTEARDMTTVT